MVDEEVDCVGEGLSRLKKERNFGTTEDEVSLTVQETAMTDKMTMRTDSAVNVIHFLGVGIAVVDSIRFEEVVRRRGVFDNGDAIAIAESVCDRKAKAAKINHCVLPRKKFSLFLTPPWCGDVGCYS